VGGTAPARASSTTAARELQKLIRVGCARKVDVLFAVANMMTGSYAPTRVEEMLDLLDHCAVIKRRDLRNLDAPATRGFAAIVFMRAICERQSLLARIRPLSERYAYKHMKYLRTLPPGGEQVTISGPELLSLMALSQQYWDHPHKRWRW
jgi:hypothetical protein